MEKEKTRLDKWKEFMIWWESARKEFCEKFDYESKGLKDSSNALTLKELEDLVISLGLISPDEADHSRYNVTETEKKAIDSINQLMLEGYLIEGEGRISKGNMRYTLRRASFVSSAWFY